MTEKTHISRAREMQPSEPARNLAEGVALAETSGSARSEEIQREIQALSNRDLQLWSIVLLVLVVLAGGFLGLVAPNLANRPAALIRVEERLLPQLFSGLIALIVLFNIYLIMQKRVLNATRRRLVRELLYNERLASLSLLDPLTQLLNHRSMEQLIPKEVARANRLGTSLTFLMIDLDGFKSVNTRFGHQVGDQCLLEAARLVKNTFRGSDTVFRYGGDEFLVMMPDTAEAQAECAIERLKKAVDLWNLNSNTEYEIAFSWGAASYKLGMKVTDVLDRADARMFDSKRSVRAQDLHVQARQRVKT